MLKYVIEKNQGRNVRHLRSIRLFNELGNTHYGTYDIAISTLYKFPLKKKCFGKFLQKLYVIDYKI